MSNQDTSYPKHASGKPITLEGRTESRGGRLFSPSTGRNKDVVRDVFLRVMPPEAEVLEIASGTGEHGAHITAAAPGVRWTYSDIDPAGRASQMAWAHWAGHGRLIGPIELDVHQENWGEAERIWDGMFCANMIHIAPFSATEMLFRGAGRLLKRGGLLFLYGPFSRKGEIAPSNARFSEDLKRRAPDWGVRDLDLELVPTAKQFGLHLTDYVEMPANNGVALFQAMPTNAK